MNMLGSIPHQKFSFFIIYLLEDEQELSLGMLIRLQRIYNFLLYQSMQQTLGLLPRLCTGTSARLEHRPRPESKRSRDLKDQHASQRVQYQARGSRYHQEKS